MVNIVYEKAASYLYLIIVAATISTVFWIMYGAYNYNAFMYTYNDIGRDMQSIYLLLHHPAIVYGLQYLVVSNHIAPDEVLFVAPLVYLYQSPYTLFFIESLVLSFTAVLIFVIVDRLTGNNKFALILGIAYLLNGGMQGMLIFEFHEEFLIIPMLLLLFYYYMKLNKRLFYLTLVLSLAVMDSAVFPTLVLGIGLLYFEALHGSSASLRKERMFLAAAIIIASLVALFAYFTYANVLISSYATGYAKVPPTLRVLPFDGAPIAELLFGNSARGEYAAELNTMAFHASPANLYTGVLIILDILFGVVAFGITSFVEPVLLLILIFPWLIQVAVLRHMFFGTLLLEYYAYVIGGTIIASILGYMLLAKADSKPNSNSIMWRIKHLVNRAVLPSLLLLVWAIFLLSLIIRVPVLPSINNPCISQLNWVIARVPNNASLVTMNFIAAHTANRVYIEELPKNLTNTMYFKPEYALVDFNKCFSELYANGAYTQLFYNYTNSFDEYVLHNGYHLVMSNGTSELWVLNSSR
jgi:uncharacterized membrane protein